MPAEAIRLLPFETEFARAWDTPGHTGYRLPDTDVNQVLAARYTTGRPLTVTRSMLWDMETRKATSFWLAATSASNSPEIHSTADGRSASQCTRIPA